MKRWTNRRIEWLLRRLAAPRDGDDDVGREALAGGAVAKLFGRRASDAIFAAEAPGTQNTEERRGGHGTWTIFDLRQLASALDELRGEEAVRTLLDSIANGHESDCHDDEAMQRFWHEAAKGATRLQNTQQYTWEGLLMLPHRSAAARIFSFHGKSSAEVRDEAVDDCLRHQAARTLEQLEHFTLPSLRRRLRDHERHRQRQRKRHEAVADATDAAFEAWDGHCLRALGVASDEVPLFPALTEGRASDTEMEGYAADVGRVAIGPMRRELEARGGRVVRSLATNAVDGDGSSGAGGEAKCFGRDVAEAMVYYRQFRRFVRGASGADDDDEAKGGGGGDDDDLSTLRQFVASSAGGDVPAKESLVQQFVTSPATRTALVGDLQRLEAFLAARQRELSSRSIHARGGRAVVDDVALRWTQYCIQHRAPVTSSSSGRALEGIALDDVARFHAATGQAARQIVGDGANAKRLRFLADAVGLPTDEAVFHNNVKFRSICHQAAHLAHRMTLYQDEQERSTKMIQVCDAAVGSTKEEVLCLERRIGWISQGIGDEK